jgi:hypothetical protein
VQKGTPCDRGSHSRSYRWQSVGFRHRAGVSLRDGCGGILWLPGRSHSCRQTTTDLPSRARRYAEVIPAIPAPTTQTSARVFLSNADDRMIEAVATQTEGVLRRLDRCFRAVLFLEGRLEVFFDMIGNGSGRASPGGQIRNVGTQLRMRIWRPGQLPKSVKLQRPARATVCSHSVRDATASVELILNKYLSRKVVKSARLMDGTDAF